MDNEDVILEFNYKNPQNNPYRDKFMEDFIKDLPPRKHKAEIGDIARISMQKTFNHYMENVAAYCSKSKLTCPYTMMELEPNEKLMCDVEKQMGIKEHAVEDYRRQIMAHLGSVVARGLEWKIDSNPKLHKAIEAYTWKGITQTANKILDNKKS